MSLINQMLKELDARRMDVSGGGSFGGQVRAVPDRRRVHPAWWVALALGVTLVCVLGWVLLRPPAVEPYVVRAQLPLRMDVGLAAAAVVAPEPGHSAGTDATSVPPETGASNAPVAEPEPDLPSGHLSQEPLMVPALVPSQVPAVAASNPPTVKQPVAVVQSAALQATASAAVPAPAMAAEDGGEPRITKKVRELTPAQLAENAFRKATLAMQQGRKSEARSGFEEALRIDLRHAAARQALIAVLIEGGSTAEALRQAREGVELDGRQVGLAMILARLQLEKADLSGALDTLEQARAHAGERVDFIAFHAALLQRASRHKEAAEQYLLALQKTPQNALWWMGLGISLQAEQRTAEAQEAFQRAKAGNSLSPELAAFVDQRLAQLK